MSAQLQESYADLERKVADRTKELAALNAIAAVASQSLELDEVLNDALDKTLQVMETEAGGIYLLDQETELLTIAAYRGFSPEFVKDIDRLRVGEGLSGHVAQSCQPLVVRDVSSDPRLTRMVVQEEGLRSVAIAPLRSQRKVLGTLFAATHGYREFTDQDVQLLTSIGLQIGVAVENARLFNAEQRRAEQFRVIGEVGSRITSILAINELLSQMAGLIQQAFGYYHVGIGLVVGDEIIYRVGAGALWDDPRFQFQPARLKVGHEGITGWVAATGEPLLVPDVSKEPRYVWMRGSETRSELTVPIRAKGEIIGVLDVQSDCLNAFDESDVVVLQSLANQAAVAIENARLFAERERRLDEMAVLNGVGRAISSTLRLDELLDLIHHQVGRVMDATNLYIALYDRDKDWVSFPLYVEGGQVRRHAGGRKAGQGLTEHIIRNRQPLLLPDDVEGRMQELGVEAIGAPARSWLGVPMIAGDEVLGVIAVQSYTTENVYDQGHLSLLPTIAAQAAIAIENARLYEQARQLAVIEERQRLARELHDAVTQTLFSASLIAEALPTLWENDQDEGRQLLQDLRQLSRGALAEMRTLLMELRPTALAEANLRDLLHQLGEAVTGRTGVPVTVTVQDQVDLPSDARVALYRIAQEALNNVVKHARASQVTVSLRCHPPSPSQRGGAVELCIRDDGRGFDLGDVEPGELGLGIMRERAQAIGATLNIESQPGHGTQVAVVWEGRNGNSRPHR
jgi:GAF domain-containing protein